MKRWQHAAVVAGMLGSMCAQGQQSLADANRLHPAALTHAAAQSVEPAASLEDALHLLFAQADVVFTGTVTKIEMTDGAVIIRFLVDDAVRGVTSGSTYTLREWCGLWADDPSRYVEGQRRLMLLHGASTSGYASPVWRTRGAIPLRGDAAQQLVDLRWLATEIQAATPGLQPMTAISRAGIGGTQDSSTADGTIITDMLHAWQRAEVTQ